jgi:uncharacterized protein (DUF58 family)
VSGARGNPAGDGAGGGANRDPGAGGANRAPGGPGAALGLSPELLRALERLLIPSRRPVLGATAGQRLSRRHGSSLDLADYRAYAPGDDIRRLDWSAYARLGRLFMRLYAAEEDACATLWVDTSASMAWDEQAKLGTALSVAGALSFLALAAEDRAACVGFSSRVVGRAGPVRGKRSAQRLWSALLDLPSGGGTDWAVVATAARSLPKGVAVVISDFLCDPREIRPALSALRAAGNEVHLVQVLSPEEVTPSLQGELRLVDSESGRVLELTASNEVLASYQAERVRHARELSLVAASCGARLASVQGGVPLRQILFGQLVRARLVR